MSCVFPPRCPVCGRLRFPWESSVCEECTDVLSYVHGPVCMRCGRELISESEEYCTACKENPPRFIRNFALWRYDRNMKQSIAAFKYNGRTEYTGFYVRNLAGVLGERILRCGVTALVPVPCSAKRKRYRGYNQSELLAKALAEKLGISYWDCLVRRKDTLPQNALNPKERKANLFQAFSWNQKEDSDEALPVNVAVVDDIFTTGSTLNACAEVLLQHGIQNVYGVCVCIGGE